jgi:hypothetical protein
MRSKVVRIIYQFHERNVLAEPLKADGRTPGFRNTQCNKSLFVIYRP